MRGADILMQEFDQTGKMAQQLKPKFCSQCLHQADCNGLSLQLLGKAYTIWPPQHLQSCAHLSPQN